MNESMEKILNKLATLTVTSGIRTESRTWLPEPDDLPLWSRRRKQGSDKWTENYVPEKWHNFEIEYEDLLWSLWGSLHPNALCFDKVVRGKQSLACCVVACCAASVYKRLAIWNGKLLDAIVVNGDRYHRESVERNELWNRKVSIADLYTTCKFERMKFMVHFESIAFGQLYAEPTCSTMNLSEALNYFFSRYQTGILCCQRRKLAFGYTAVPGGGYYLFDCQEWDEPIFPPNMGASYLLRTQQIQLLLYCLVVALCVRKRNIRFTIYNVEIMRLPTVQESEDPEGES